MNIIESDILSLNNLIFNLEEFRKKLNEIDYIHNKKNFFDLMKELRKFLASTEYKDIYKTFLHSKYYNFYKAYFTSVNTYYLRSIESLQSISIMTKGIHNFDSFADLMDVELIRQSFDSKRKETKHINFSNAKTLVMVGSGALPETLLYFYENSNIENIVGIDYNHEAIFMAGEMISGLNLNKITLFQGNGIHYDYSNADIIYMPLFTSPKNEILNRIVETGKDNVQILIAIPKGLGNLIYEGIDGEINNRLKIKVREDVSHKYNFQEVILLEKYNF